MKTTQQMEMELQKKFPFLKIISEYTGANNKVKILCTKCGTQWEAIPRSVAKSQCGCKFCQLAESKHRQAHDKFFKQLDKDKFELLDFNSPTDVVVKCKVCGNIRHTTSDNILRYGCRKCGFVLSATKQSLGLDKFIKKANIVHNNKYDYSQTVYKSYHDKLRICCPKHGLFLQDPSHHLRGHGCPICSGSYQRTTEDFIKKAKAVHGEKYDYSKSVYTRNDEPLIITCKKHGDFKQVPYAHVDLKCGCPKCAASHGEQEIINYLKNINVEYVHQYFVNINSKKVVVDFKIDIKGEVYFIEYNGEQHYRPIKYFGGNEKFEKQQKRDSDLRDYCKENKIHLLEIKFDHKEDIKTLIDNFINAAVSQSDLRNYYPAKSVNPETGIPSC